MFKKFLTKPKKNKISKMDAMVCCPSCGFRIHKIVQFQLSLPTGCPECGKFNIQSFKEVKDD